MKNLPIKSFIALIFLFSSCEINFSSEGQLYLQSIRNEYRCFEITNGLGDGFMVDSIKKKFYFVYFTFTSCCGKYSYENIVKKDSVILNVAKVILNYVVHKEIYQGIELVFTNFTDSPNSKRFFYSINNIGNLVLKSIGEETSAF